MTKTELARRISLRMQGVDHPEAVRFIELFAAEVKAAIIRGERVDLRGFGGFAPVVRKAKIGRIITPGKGGPGHAINIPARTVPVFRPSDQWLAQMSNVTAISAGHPREGGDLDQLPGWCFL